MNETKNGLTETFDEIFPVHLTWDEASAILTALQSKIEDLGADLRNPRRNRVYVARSREEAQSAFQAIMGALPRGRS